MSVFLGATQFLFVFEAQKASHGACPSIIQVV